MYNNSYIKRVIALDGSHYTIKAHNPINQGAHGGIPPFYYFGTPTSLVLLI